jgi:hypothetical protein
VTDNGVFGVAADLLFASGQAISLRIGCPDGGAVETMVVRQCRRDAPYTEYKEKVYVEFVG